MCFFILNYLKLFAFAGLWDKWQQEDEVLFTCTMLTKEANDFMQEIHHRMPIILSKDKEDEWVKLQIHQPVEAYRFLQTVQSEDFTAYQVESYVNSAKNNDATCIEPIA